MRNPLDIKARIPHIIIMTISNLFKEKALRKRVYFTIFVLAVCCGLTQIPVVGVNSDFLANMFVGSSLFGFVDSMSGGSIARMSMAGFGITSYITATIVLQLTSIVVPGLEAMFSTGEVGRKRQEKVSFILALIITGVSGLSLAIGYGSQGFLTKATPLYMMLAVGSWVLGSFIIMFLALKVEKYGIGNGVSLVLGCNIISRIPRDIINFYNDYIQGSTLKTQALYITGLAVAAIAIYLVAVYLQHGMLNIPIQHTRKEASIMNQAGRLPINVNIVNVMPVIYASVFLAIPTLIATIFNLKDKKIETILSFLDSSHWYTPENWMHVAGLLLYLLLIVGFAMYSVDMMFNTADVAHRMRENGDVIPYVAPGMDTMRFLKKRTRRMTLLNVVFLLVLTVLPDAVCAWLNITSFSFFGTSLMIAISMLFDTSLRIRATCIHNDKRFVLFPEFNSKNETK